MDFHDYDNEGDVWTFVLLELRGGYWKVLRTSDYGDIQVAHRAVDTVSRWYEKADRRMERVV